MKPLLLVPQVSPRSFQERQTQSNSELHKSPTSGGFVHEFHFFESHLTGLNRRTILEFPAYWVMRILCADADGERNQEQGWGAEIQYVSSPLRENLKMIAASSSADIDYAAAGKNGSGASNMRDSEKERMIFFLCSVTEERFSFAAFLESR